jgi:membrane associated rhomboid family serine protease
MAVLLLLVRHGGGQYTQLLVLLGVNLVFGFLGSGVSWQAHVGGLVFGLAAGELLVLLRRRVVWQWVALAGLGVVALALVWTLTDPVALFSRL